MSSSFQIRITEIYEWWTFCVQQTYQELTSEIVPKTSMTLGAFQVHYTRKTSGFKSDGIRTCHDCTSEHCFKYSQYGLFSWSWFHPFTERQILEWPTLLKLYTNNTNALPATNWEAYARQLRHPKRSAWPPTRQLSSTRCLCIQILIDNWRQEYECADLLRCL